MLSPKPQKMPLRNREFSRKIAEDVKNLNRCYQCSMCTDGCPVAYAMDYHPNEIVYMTRLGLKDEVLKSSCIWICVSCETCASRCPNDIDIVHLMDVLRGLSLQEKVRSPVNKIPQFHRAFLRSIRSRGRVDTVELLLNYELKTGDVFSSLSKFREQGRQALEMLRKGKIKVGLRKKHGQKKTKEIFKKILAPR